MNKYQEYKQKLREAPQLNNPYLDAILRVIMDFEDRVENDNVLTLGVMDIEKLIELVDIAIPKKPNMENLNYICCPNCHSDEIELYDYHGTLVKLKHCNNCGQQLDWSNNES